MKIRLLAWMLALMILSASHALAGGKEQVFDALRHSEQTGNTLYAYGGSRRDWVHDMAVAPDGRIAITGYTESSDGTLFDRTKTWRAGWVTMIAPDMQVMWNYCSRSGDADHIHAPVFHADGTLSVVHETEGMQMKVVRLDQNGQDIRSQTVLYDREDDVMHSLRGKTQAGYLFATAKDYGASVSYSLFNFGGTRQKGTEDFKNVAAVGKNHAIIEDDDGFCLYALDEKGTARKVALLYQREPGGGVKRRYNDMISLAGGGAAACGAIWKDSWADADGLISCWDENGSLVFEMVVVRGEMLRLIETELGFAATCAAQEDLGLEVDWSLVHFDRRGIICDAHPLETTETMSNGGPLAALPDGRIVCAQAVGVLGNEDVLVTIVE